MSKGVTNGMYNGKLSMDTLPYTAMLGTCSVDSIAADSANTASAYMTGHKSSVNALGVYADRTPDSLDDPKQETIAELLRRTTGKSIGVVSDAEIEDATPASVVGHTRRRADKAEIVDMFYSVKPDVIIGGRFRLLPASERPRLQAQGRQELRRNVPEGRLCPRHVQHRAFQGREGQPRQAARLVPYR